MDAVLVAGDAVDLMRVGAPRFARSSSAAGSCTVVDAQTASGCSSHASSTDLTVRDLLAAFRSRRPTPGGGSAAALAGAVGAALLTMVAGLPKPRAETDEDRARAGGGRRRCARLRDALAALVDRDSEAYEQVMAAYRLPEGDG